MNNRYPPKLSVSRSKLKKYGEALRANPEDQEALNIVNTWRSSHMYPMQIFSNTLRNKAQEYRTNQFTPIVAQRLKRMPTIIRKLNRFSDMSLPRMQDIGGVRAILKSSSDVRSLYGKYISARFPHTLVRTNDYISTPKNDGYRGIHMVYKYISSKPQNGPSQYNGLPVEIQIRSDLQHEWSTAVEALGMLYGKSIKNGMGSKKWKDFFKIASSAFAMVEKEPVLEEHKDLDFREIAKLLSKANRKANAINTLRGFNISTDRIIHHEDARKVKFTILSLDTERRTITIRGFNNIELANTIYSKLEKENNTSIDHVLVNVGVMKDLTRAYPNYFLDINKFCERIEDIINNIDQ